MCLQPESHLKVASGNSAFFLILFPLQEIFYFISICAVNFQISRSLTAASKEVRRSKSSKEAAENTYILRHTSSLTRASC